MREAVMLQLERFCYYQHLSLSGGRERPIFACRIMDIRGSRFHVLSRIQDAGLDFTGRTNFIAHHLVFAPDEIRQNAPPPVILRDWPGWVKSWTKEPELLENEDWSGLAALAGRTNVPAQTWKRVTGDAVNGYGLLETRAGATFLADDQPDEIVLGLIAESLELLEVRDPRKDFRATAWEYTFTTSMQEQDNPADFRWRCIHSDNPAANRFATPDCHALSAVRATKLTAEETAFARMGRQSPRFVVEPQDVRVTEGEAARFAAKAEGVPSPIYQWYSVDRANNGQILPGETNPELVVSTPALGVSRYIVSITNSAGKAQSKVAILSVEQKLKLAQAGMATGSRGPAKPALYNVKTADDIERQRRRLEAERAQEIFHRRQRRNKILVAILAMVLIVVAGLIAWKKFASRKSVETPPAVSPATQSAASSTSQAVTQSEQPGMNPRNDLPQTGFGLPDGWAQLLIGTVSNPNVEYVSPRFDLSGAAKGFLTNEDNVLFVSTTNNASKFQATFLNSELSSSASRCGIMMRKSQNPAASFLFIGASSEKVYVYCRDDERKFISSDYEIPKSNQSKPIYFRFRQTTNRVIPQYSYDSKNWFPNDTNTIYSNSCQLIGLAICSGSVSNKVIAKFGGVIQSDKPSDHTE